VAAALRRGLSISAVLTLAGVTLGSIPATAQTCVTPPDDLVFRIGSHVNALSGRPS
jgi:hypothetical protein